MEDFIHLNFRIAVLLMINNQNKELKTYPWGRYSVGKGTCYACEKQRTGGREQGMAGGKYGGEGTLWMVIEGLPWKWNPGSNIKYQKKILRKFYNALCYLISHSVSARKPTKKQHYILRLSKWDVYFFWITKLRHREMQVYKP